MPLVMLISIVPDIMIIVQALVQSVILHSQCVVLPLKLLHCTAMMVRMMYVCLLNIIVCNTCMSVLT